MIKSLTKFAAASALSLGLIASFSIINDRGGFLSIDNLLNVGREYVRTQGVAHASQGSGCLPTTGTVSGLSMTQNINSAIQALISSNSGASPPATDCTAAPVKGQVWLDTSLTPNVLKKYDGTAWTVIGAIDTSNHLWAPPIGGGNATIASAAGVTDLWSNPASSITISGTNAITGLANGSAVPGTVKVVTASGAFSLTHNGTSLILPSAPPTPLAVSVGDRFLAVALNSTNVAVFAYTKADGSALVNPSVPLGTVLYGFYATIPAKAVYGEGQALSRSSYPDYFATVTRQQSGSLTTGSPTITSLSNTAGLGPGMPVEGPGIPAGAVVVSKTSSTITLSANVLLTNTYPVRVFLTGYGTGGDSTTVGVPDCVGRTMAGRDFGAGRLTASYFGSGGSVINGSGGSESQTLTQAQLPAVAPTFAGGPSVVTLNSSTVNIIQGSVSSINVTTGGPGIQILSGASSGGISVTGNYTPAGSISNLGSSAPHPIVQPTLIAECVVAVLP